MWRPSDGVVALTAYRLEDAPTHLLADLDPHHCRAFEAPEDFVATLEHVQGVIRGWMAPSEDVRVYAVRAVEDGALLGGVEVRVRGERTGSLAYWTYPAHRGRGVARRAVSLVVQRERALGRFSELLIWAGVWNTASHRVAEGCGFEAVPARVQGERRYRLGL